MRVHERTKQTVTFRCQLVQRRQSLSSRVCEVLSTSLALSPGRLNTGPGSPFGKKLPRSCSLSGGLLTKSLISVPDGRDLIARSQRVGDSIPISDAKHSAISHHSENSQMNRAGERDTPVFFECSRINSFRDAIVIPGQSVSPAYGGLYGPVADGVRASAQRMSFRSTRRIPVHNAIAVGPQPMKWGGRVVEARFKSQTAQQAANKHSKAASRFGVGAMGLKPSLNGPCIDSGTRCEQWE